MVDCLFCNKSAYVPETVKKIKAEHRICTHCKQQYEQEEDELALEAYSKGHKIHCAQQYFKTMKCICKEET
jgi:transcription elongation factor Elf1